MVPAARPPGGGDPGGTGLLRPDGFEVDGEAAVEAGVEKLLRDAELTQIYEGTNQIASRSWRPVAAERAAPA